MRRRTIIAALGSTAAAWPLGARAQPKPRPTIGILGAGFPEDRAIALNLAMFRRGLRQEGFVEGQNVDVEYKWARNQPEQLPKLAAELVARPVDLLVNEGGTITAIAAKQATSTIPIVFHSSNAIEDDLVGNLARPSGNLTGVSLFATETLAKAFQLLTELVPITRTVALLTAGTQQPALAERVMQDVRGASAAKGVELRLVNAVTDAEIEAAYAAFAGLKAAVIVFANATYVDKLVGLAARYALPAAYNQRAFAVAGGLLSYGASIPAAYVTKGYYAGKILKGAKPGDLPVQQASKFELVLNLKTAEALDLIIPPTILASTDEVIE